MTPANPYAWTPQAERFRLTLVPIAISAALRGVRASRLGSVPLAEPIKPRVGAIEPVHRSASAIGSLGLAAGFDGITFGHRASKSSIARKATKGQHGVAAILACACRRHISVASDPGSFGAGARPAFDLSLANSDAVADAAGGVAVKMDPTTDVDGPTCHRYVHRRTTTGVRGLHSYDDHESAAHIRGRRRASARAPPLLQTFFEELNQRESEMPTDNILDFTEARERKAKSEPKPRKTSRCPYANRSSEQVGRAPVVLVFETEWDHLTGMAGGMGRLELAIAVLNVNFAERVRAPLTFAETRGLDHGLGAIVLRAIEGSFDVLVVSELRSLGPNLSTAQQLVDLLEDGLGQTIYVATHGFVTSDELAALWAANT